MDTISRCLLTFILNSLWQIPLIAVMAALVCRFIRKGPAGDRHIVWTVALAAALLIPAGSIRLPLSSAESTPNVIPMPPVGIAPGPMFTPQAKPVPAAMQPRNRSVAFAGATAAALLACYLLFLAFRIGRLIAVLFRTSRIRRNARPAIPSPSVASVWNRCQTAFDAGGVELLASPSIPGPVMTGAFRRSIVIPDALLHEPSDDLLATAIGHEMAHAARHDFVWNVVCELLYAPVSFHPAAVFLHRAIARTREVACDELVTNRLLQPEAYARSIVSIAASMTTLPRPGFTLGVLDGDILEERIRRLMESPRTARKRGGIVLATGFAALAICAVFASTLAISARAQAGSNVELKLAGEAYNSGDFKSAAAHFDNVVQSDPSNAGAKLFLANALIRQFYQQKDPPDSPLLVLARRQYLDTLASEPQNKRALEGLIAVAMNAKQPRAAHDWAMKLIQADPRDKAGYYTIGVLDWAEVYPQFAQARQSAGGDPHDYGIPNAAMRKDLRDRFMPVVEDGFRMLQTALQIDPNYFDAMAYMNLLCRLKAGMVDNPDEGKMWIAKSDEWVRQALNTRRQKIAGAGETSTLNIDGPPPGPPSATSPIAGPPKPPPPPPAPGVAPGSGNDAASSLAPPGSTNPAEHAASYWQIAGGNGITAGALIQRLNDNGFRAAPFLFPKDHLTRVMAGPYSNERSLQQAKSALEASGFQTLRVW